MGKAATEPEDSVAAETEQEKLDRWHRDELHRLGFNPRQRAQLLKLIDSGEVELYRLRELIEKRGWSTEQVFLSEG